MNKKREDIINGINNAIVDEFRKSKPDPMTGIECAVNAVVNLMLNVSASMDCPDPVRFVSELLHSAAEQVGQQAKQEVKLPTKTS